VVLSALPASTSADDCETVEGRVQIVLDLGGLIGLINFLLGTTTLDAAPPAYLLEIPLGSTVEEIIDLLLGLQVVQAAEPAFLSATPEAERQKVVAAVGGTIEDFEDQHFLQRIGAALLHAEEGGDGVTVAIIDSGILASHEALATADLLLGPDYVDDDLDPAEAANGLDDDGDGLIDEGFGHGTMVAGLTHVMAPEATLQIIRVLDDEGRGTVFDVVKAIRHAVDTGADVVNLSLGLLCDSEVLAEEVARAAAAGVTVIAAAGNDSQELPPVYPAADANTLSVAALDSVDVKAWFSNYHLSVDISAPGEGLLVPFADGGYALCAGTSFAAPLIAGQAAIVRGLRPLATKGEVDDLCRAGVVDIYDIPDNVPYLERLGTGRIDGASTLSALGITLGVSPASKAATALVSMVGNPLRATGPVIVEVASGIEAVDVFDVSGRRLVTLPVNGTGILAWDGRDAEGRPVGAGVVLLRPASSQGDALRLVRY
jgi:subtilisin family serine protease